MLLVALPVFQNDVPKLRTLLEWIHTIGGCRGHRAVIVADAGTLASDVFALKDEAARSFDSVDVVSTKESVTGWIAGSGSLFIRAMEYAQTVGLPWLFLEPDATPLKKGWLDAIAQAYRSLPAGKTYLGALVPCVTPGLPPMHFTGVGVYPPAAFLELAGIVALNTKVAFDLPTASVIVPKAVNSNLFQHLWGEANRPPTFAERGIPKTNVFDLSYIRPDAVIFHRNKDHTLIDLLRKRDFSGKTYVSLRRAGDIIALLPALRRISIRDKTIPRLVVHRDFVSVLEGVSYVSPVIWTDGWEEPMAAAKMHKAINAQVFGKGVKTNVINGNFVKNAWSMIGEPWNRHTPLVFDRRDFTRERNLAENVFITDKPKLLLKLHGFSSPFNDGAFVEAEIRRHFGSRAEIVRLDDVKAERLYDLLGLMDRAACLVSIDTVALHLAHASKCPVVAFTNPTGFGGTPARGNTILRMGYHEVRKRWHEVLRAVESTVAIPTSNEKMVLVYSYFVPKDADTKRRQDAAWETWPLLGARLHAVSGKRTSKTIGDKREMPFIRDMISSGFSSGDEGILVLTNNDIKFHSELKNEIVSSCRETGCFWSYRVEKDGGPTDEGADVFAFTRYWWQIHQHLLPDFLLGYWWWDSTLLRIMLWSGCAERKRLYYHETHKNASPTRQHEVGTNYNQKLAMAWLNQHDEQPEKARLY